MNKVRQILLTAALTTMTATTFAYDVKVDGIYYNLNTEAETAEVTYQSESGGGYSGNVVIPASFAYNGKHYSVTSIGEEAFTRCNNLISVAIPNSVATIGNWAFDSCPNLTSITIPASVTNVGIGISTYCPRLESIIVDESNPIYDSRDNCNAIIKSSSNEMISGCNTTTIPHSVTTLAEYCLSGSYGLTSIEIPISVTSIGESAFEDCLNLTSIVIPNSVTNIERVAFGWCPGLTTVTIGSGIKSLGEYAFASCDNLSEVTCLAVKVPDTEAEAFDDSLIGKATLIVPAIALSTYQKTEPWSQFGNIKTIEGEKEACAAPTIRFEDGELRFNCEMEAAQICYTISPQDAQIATKYAENWIVPLTGCYDITCYATAEGYLPSEVVTTQLYWIEPANEAISINPTPMRGITVQSVHGFVTVTGLAKYEHITYYDTAGTYLGRVESIDGTASFTAPANTIVMVKIGTRSIKVNVR